MNAAELRAEFDTVDAEWKAGARHLRYRVERAYSAWFRQSIAEGRSPDALVGPTLYGEELLRHHSMNGAEHVYWKGPAAIRLEEGGARNPRIFARELSLGRKISDYHEVVERVCDERSCIRVSHLRLREKRRKTLSEAEAISMLRSAARTLGRSPTTHDQHTGAPHHATILKLFGSWKAGLDAAGLESDFAKFHKHSDDDILEAIRVKSAELGRVPTPADWEYAKWIPSYATIRRRFPGKGGFVRALAKAGVK